MRAHIIKDGVVVNTIEVESLDFMPGLIDAEQGSIGDLWDGQAFSKPPAPVKSPEQVQAEVVAGTQQRLDTFAQTRNYDGILSACAYASSTVPTFAAEGTYCLGARDATWAALYALMAQVQAGNWPIPGAGQMPTGYADIEPSLPALEWPA